MTSGFNPVFTVTNAIAAALARIERARRFLEAATLSDDWIRRMGGRALILEAHQPHIEGTSLTLDQAERLLGGDSVAGADPDDVRELLNYRRAFDFVSSHLGRGGPVTEGLIREIHGHLVEGVRGGAAGAGRVPPGAEPHVNSATGRSCLHPAARGRAGPVADLVAWLNDARVHPVIVSGAPSSNSSTSTRSWMETDARRASSRRSASIGGLRFQAALHDQRVLRPRPCSLLPGDPGVRERGMDLTGWLEFFTEGLATQLDEVKARGKRAIRRDLLAREHRLTERQGRTLAHILEVGVAATTQDLERLHPGVSRRSLQRDLKVMMEKGLLVSEGATNRREYRAKPAP